MDCTVVHVLYDTNNVGTPEDVYHGLFFHADFYCDLQVC